MSRRDRDDDNYDPSSQRAKSKGTGGGVGQAASRIATAHSLNKDDVEKMVSDATFYFLVADQKKSLIKKPDLCKACDLSKKSKQVQDDVIDAAKSHLLFTFGIKAVESESKKSHYYLINQLQEKVDDDGLQHIVWSEKENAQMALTFTILGLVFMSNGKVSDETLFKFLKQMGVFQEEGGKKGGRGNQEQGGPIEPEITELFEGDVKKFVNEVLVGKQHYLRRERVQGPDPEVESYEYTWGERADLEVKKSDVLKMVCELYDCEARMFKEQFDKVREAEGDVMDED